MISAVSSPIITPTLITNSVMKRTLSQHVLLIAVLLTSSACGDDWPHWRGPLRNDVTGENSGWNGSAWPLKKLWDASVGEGSSAAIVVGNNVFLVGWANDHDTVYCLSAETGREIWKQSYQSPQYGRFSVGDKSLYSAVCSTPEYDKETGLLFTLGIDGDLIARDANTRGKQVWTLNLYDRYGAVRRPEVAERRKTQRDYGYVSSPLVIGDQLIVEVGAKNGNLVSFDKRTGAQNWVSENRDEAGHTGGPVPIEVEGVPCVAVLTLRNLVVTRIGGANPGKQVAVYPWTTDFGNNIATVAVSGDSVVVTSAYNHVAMCRLKITLGGASKVWENKLASGVCSPLIHDGHIYWAWQGIHCVDFATGQQLWTGGKVGPQGSCILTADDRLIVYANKGDLLLTETAKRSPDKYTELAAQKVFSETDAWPHITAAGSRLICRDRSGNVRCFAVSAE